MTADFAGVQRHVDRSLELHPESLGPRWPQTVALALDGRFDEAIAAAERVIARTRAPIFLGVMGMIYARAGRLADARRLAQELDERQSRGEYVVPAARLSIHVRLRKSRGYPPFTGRVPGRSGRTICRYRHQPRAAGRVSRQPRDRAASRSPVRRGTSTDLTNANRRALNRPRLLVSSARGLQASAAEATTWPSTGRLLRKA